jgi:hypothetical protein
METTVHPLSSEGEPYASYRLTNFIDEAIRNVFPSPVDNSIIFFAENPSQKTFRFTK